MFKYFSLLLLFGCQLNTNLSITPQDSYVPTLEVASLLTYTKPSYSIDPYLNNNNIITVNGVIGQFKCVINNTNNIELKNISVVVIVNNIDLISTASLARIYHQIFWGGELFNAPTPFVLPDGNMYDSKIYGTYTVLSGDDLPAMSSIVFDSIIIGYPGLEIHLGVFATTPDGQYASSYGQAETTVVFN